MYKQHFGLRENPFSLLPDPNFLFLTKKHESALTVLRYGLETEATITVVTGEIGSGKTTLIRSLIDDTREDITVGLISNTHSSFGNLLEWILYAFGIPNEENKKVSQYQAFTEFVISEYAKGRRTILIVDEAQNMDIQTLEELRMLSNLNVDQHQVLQLILIGQPELRDLLNSPRLKQFSQRVALDYHINALDQEETFGYIRFRVLKAGGASNLFSDGAKRALYCYSGGIPRVINVLCNHALVHAYGSNLSNIHAEHVESMAKERGIEPVFDISDAPNAVPQHSSAEVVQRTVQERGNAGSLEVSPHSGNPKKESIVDTNEEWDDSTSNTSYAPMDRRRNIDSPRSTDISGSEPRFTGTNEPTVTPDRYSLSQETTKTDSIGSKIEYQVAESETSTRSWRSTAILAACLIGLVFLVFFAENDTLKNVSWLQQGVVGEWREKLSRWVDESGLDEWKEAAANFVSGENQEDSDTSTTEQMISANLNDPDVQDSTASATLEVANAPKPEGQQEPVSISEDQETLSELNATRLDESNDSTEATLMKESETLNSSSGIVFDQDGDAGTQPKPVVEPTQDGSSEAASNDSSVNPGLTQISTDSQRIVDSNNADSSQAIAKLIEGGEQNGSSVEDSAKLGSSVMANTIDQVESDTNSSSDFFDIDIDIRSDTSTISEETDPTSLGPDLSLDDGAVLADDVTNSGAQQPSSVLGNTETLQATSPDNRRINWRSQTEERIKVVLGI